MVTVIRTYLVHFVLKTCFYCVIGLIASGISSAQDINTTEIENDLPGNKTDQIINFLENIPQYSQNLYIGPLELYPSFEITETFNDNVFGAANDKVGDFYATYEPGLRLLLPFFGRHSVTVDYRAEIFNYLRIQERNHVNQFLRGSLNLNFRKGFSVNLSNQISAIRRPGGISRRTNPTVLFDTGEDGEEIEEIGAPEGDVIEEEFGFNTFTNRRDITTNNASVVIELPDFLNKFDFEIHYSNRDVSFQRPDRDSNERNDDIFGGAVIMRPLPKIMLSTGFDYGIARYDSATNLDSTFQRIPFNISWQPTRKSNFFLNTRFNIRDYGSNGIFKNFEGWDATLGYRFNVTDRDKLTIKFERSLKEQQFRTTALFAGFEETGPEETDVPLRLRDVNTETVGDNNPSFFTQINIDYTHIFTRNFSITVSPYYQNRRFRETADFEQEVTRFNLEEREFVGVSRITTIPQEKIDVIGFDITARYSAPLNWLFGEVSYSFQDRKSNISGGDLVRNVGRISVGLSF